MTDNAQKVYDIVSQIPKGKVLTYKKVAELAGIKSPRLVGKILHANPDPDTIPCHRVVNSMGRVAGKYAFGGAKEQIKKILNEDVILIKESVSLNKYLWMGTKIVEEEELI